MPNANTYRACIKRGRSFVRYILMACVQNEFFFQFVICALVFTRQPFEVTSKQWELAWVMTCYKQQTKNSVHFHMLATALEVCTGQNFTAQPDVHWSRGFSSWHWPCRKLVVLVKSRRPLWSCGQPDTGVSFYGCNLSPSVGLSATFCPAHADLCTAGFSTWTVWLVSLTLLPGCNAMYLLLQSLPCS